MDRNNSLKCVDTAYRHGTRRTDSRVLQSPQWIEPEEVDLYKDEVARPTTTSVRNPIFYLYVSLALNPHPLGHSSRHTGYNSLAQ
jgi:hypothetical protein